jgi:hypothetical protein
MVFSDSTTKLGIVEEIDSLCDTSSTSYPINDKTRRVNNALEQVVGWLINADGTWQFDDSNNSDLPIGTQTLVAAQSAYTFNDKFLQLEEVQIEDIDGNWRIIQPIDQKEFSDSNPLSEIYENDGLPVYYDKVSEDTIKLYPAPSATDCTLVNGLKIKFKRTAHLFTAADTTAVPGFASPFHIILAYMAAISYCMTYKKDRVSLYEKKVMELKDELIKHYSRREKDKRGIMTFERRVYK